VPQDRVASGFGLNGEKIQDLRLALSRAWQADPTSCFESLIREIDEADLRLGCLSEKSEER
jgi:hypothetical protein